MSPVEDIAEIMVVGLAPVARHIERPVEGASSQPVGDDCLGAVAVINVPPHRMSATVAALLVALLFLLHQDFWFWREARPLVLGVLPVGLFYHVAYTVATTLLLWLLVTRLWPSHLETTRRRER